MSDTSNTPGSKRRREVLWPVQMTIGGHTFAPDEIAGALETLALWVNHTGKSKGFWDASIDPCHGAKFAKIHGEVSEAFEAIRTGNPDSAKIPAYSSVEEELADAIILILDWGQQHGHDIGAAVISKAIFNQSRERLHGKAF